MPLYNQTPHQNKQIEVISNIENQIKSSSLNFSTVEPIHDYDVDPRLCLTGIHFPNQDLLDKIYVSLIEPLRRISPNHYYYEKNSLHLTVKSVRVIHNPPHFNDENIAKAKKVFEEVVSHYHQFRVYFYRLLLFPNNLALMGTTDVELDNIVLELDRRLKDAGIPDDKQYTNSRYFFCNMTLARFNSPLSQDFIEKISELSSSIVIPPYTIESIALVTGNAVLKKRAIIESWNLL